MYHDKPGKNYKKKLIENKYCRSTCNHDKFMLQLSHIDKVLIKITFVIKFEIF